MKLKAKESFADYHGRHILRLFDVYPSLPFITSKTKRDY